MGFKMKQLKFSEDARAQIGMLKELPLFDGLDDDAFDKLAAIAVLRIFDAREIITEEGDFDPWLYILLSGSISVRLNDEELAIIDKQYEVFGEISFIEETERSATLMAITETRCVAIDAILLHEMQHSAGGSLTLHIYQ